MNGTFVIIADTARTAQTIELYLRLSLGEKIESYFMTYRRTLLSPPLVRRMDLLILELLTRDDEGYRAEGIFSAQRWMRSGRRALIVSGAGQSDSLDCLNYWDLAAPDLLHERILRLLDTPPARLADLTVLKDRFGKYCRPAVDLHGKKQTLR
uniref:Uncharacterized protein n=1 Tax=Candidatus Kentrum sp. FM TaxID=2126340 RepID=A0A450RW06_9GAMM|nr:MAG: hypothetical protein BECKFM1743A_GA0114220_1000720 [Candidatus Kentron sp. FM]VFJ43944.1 MAG: hypothetical protein BECKFM1743C_GA0114222_100071 [Candidatus Kentron sp. FM]VFK06047.1 MAG: hypothetical protein BECKFM1743B_GA0114221_1000920 [Candidatus Kentron sp. FM]